MRQPLPMAERAPEAAFRAHYARILRYVRSVVHNADEAEDLTQETFLRAYRARDSLRDFDAMLPWLYSVATHVCLDHLRQRTRHAQARSDLDPEGVSQPDPDPSAGQLVEQEEMSECVEAYVSELSD